ncbi:hypothetical protein Dsin_011184 [Dipteronia sinensis]|uniref:Retrotransposon gag domain-containing protein n=1 Tax=Dipteronia sinensis TaxID=43782 RepID=A0AAE0AV65_9ROSI|nr:hypothetical protein Dsin_011184 [Dipteronia sinensis]
MTLTDAKERISRLEKIVGVPPEKNFGKLVIQCVENMEGVKLLQQSHTDLLKDLEVQFNNIRLEFACVVDSMTEKLQSIANEISVFRKERNSSGFSSENSVLMLENDLSVGRLKIVTWETLKEELKDQFFPYNKSWLAREFLRKLRHSCFVLKYMKEFSLLLLDINNMSEDRKLFNFMKIKDGKVADLKQKKKLEDGGSIRKEQNPYCGDSILFPEEQQLMDVKAEAEFLRKDNVGHDETMLCSGSLDERMAH